MANVCVNTSSAGDAWVRSHTTRRLRLLSLGELPAARACSDAQLTAATGCVLQQLIVTNSAVLRCWVALVR